VCFGLETENRLPHPYLKRNTKSGTKPIVDVYGPEEQATSWYYYLAENLHFPFSARIVRCPTSPLKL
jgi:Calcium binding